jgi:hypothetical protein
MPKLTPRQVELLKEIKKAQGTFNVPYTEDDRADYEYIDYFLYLNLIERIADVDVSKDIHVQDNFFYKITERGEFFILASVKDENLSQVLIDKLNKLNAEGHSKVESYIDDLISSGNYDNETYTALNEGKRLA